MELLIFFLVFVVGMLVSIVGGIKKNKVVMPIGVAIGIIGFGGILVNALLLGEFM